MLTMLDMKYMVIMYVGKGMFWCGGVAGSGGGGAEWESQG
jgi:hypothetical protein